MPLPNAIIIGAQKAGTTSLFDWIAQHPEVYGNNLYKDFPFFVKDEFYNNGLQWLSNLFEKDYKNEKIILHASVDYLYFHKVSAKRIYDYNPNVKIIVVFRNPIDRAYSDFWQQKKMGYENSKTFEEALKLEKKRLVGNYRERSSLTYINHGFYYKQILTYLKYFKKENIKYIIFEEMIKNPQKTIKEVFNFLEIDENFIPNFVKANESGLPRFEKLQKLLSKPFLPRKIKNFIPLNYRFLIKKHIKNLNIKKTKYPPIKQETKLYLYKLYYKDVKNLEKILGIDLCKIWEFDV